MGLKRTYTIKFTTQTNFAYYVSELIKYDLGYRLKSRTQDIKISQNWKNKKSVDKIVKKLNAGLFQPGFDKYLCETYEYEVVEVTPIKVLRLLKLKKIKRKS